MNPATVTSELRVASVETLYPLLAFVGTSLRGFWLLRPRPLHLLPQLRPGLQTHNVLKVDLTLLVADTQIGSAPFGRCGAKINSMSTHPREEGMFGEVLEGYREAFPKGSKGTLRRLEDVRMRGRKKSMIG